MKWKTLPSNENYQVSDTGLVRRLSDKTLLAQYESAGGGKTTKYKQVSLNFAGKQKTLRVHRLVAEAFIGDVNGKLVDHENLNTFDNNLHNLRVVTHSESAKNRGKYKGSNKYKGVRRMGNRFIAACCKDYKVYTRSFPTEQDAAYYYDMMAVALHGQFAKTNKSLGLV